MSDHPTIAALKATAPVEPLPWTVDSDGSLYGAVILSDEGFIVAGSLIRHTAAHIAAAVNAAPHLLARVAELEAALEAARVAVENIGDLMDAAPVTGCDCWDRWVKARLALGLEAGNV